MDYQYQHDKIIKNFRNWTFSDGDYYEKHHIIPKCMGGSDDPSNIIKLTAKAHFIIHHLLCKIFVGNAKLASAFHIMCYHTSPGRGNGTNSRLFEIARKNYSINHFAKESEFRSKMSKVMLEKWKDEKYRDNHTSIRKSKEYWISIYDDISVDHENGYPYCNYCHSICSKRNRIFCSKKCFDLHQKKNFYRSSENHKKMVDGIKSYISSLDDHAKKMRLINSLHSDTVDHISRGKNISKSKKGKSTNQYEIMGRRYASMPDEDFKQFLVSVSPRVINRTINLRNKWINILQSVN